MNNGYTFLVTFIFIYIISIQKNSCTNYTHPNFPYIKLNNQIQPNTTFKFSKLAPSSIITKPENIFFFT